MMVSSLLRNALLVLVANLTGVCAYAEQAEFSRDQLVADLDQLHAFILNTHPDLYRSADAQELAVAVEQIRGSLSDRMTLAEAWLAMAQINPVLKDAHSGIRRPVAAIDVYREASGRLFPLAVELSDSAQLLIGADSAPPVGAQAGEQIVAINGIGSEAIVETLMPRMRGETARLRRLVLSRHFAAYYWLAFGSAESFEISVLGADGIRRLTSGADQVTTTPGSAPFSYRLLDRGAAYLDVRTFEKGRLTEFAKFLELTFTQIKQHQAQSLIIDLRQNGGGAHELSDELMGYLTASPYSYTSAVKARVSAENIARIPGAQLGDIVDVAYRQTTTPAASEPLRFAGQVYLLIGPGTYSQAIAFAAAAQDHGVATLVGQPTEGPANQTGQVQMHVATHTKLQAMAPLYVFTRASGQSGSAGLLPEIPITDRPAQPMHSVDALLSHLQPKSAVE